VLTCTFATERDLIRIYDRNGNLVQDLDWRENLDFESDVWLFDVGADGIANLVIDFYRDGSNVIADLFDDQTGDGQVAYSDQQGQITILESKVPTVRFIAQEGWWTDVGKVNYALTVLVDGDRWATFSAELYNKYLSSDGQVDVRIEVHDLDQDGRPDFEFRHPPDLGVLSPELERWSGMATHIMVNWMDSEYSVSNYVLWPHLGGYSDPLKQYGHSAPPIQMAWTESKIAAIGEFVASRGGESNCFIYTSIPLVREQINEADFENPFCFYDLAGDRDGVPEMQVRTEYWPPRNPRFVGGRFPLAMEWIRYSWDQDNDGLWDYGLGLAGRHAIESTITLGDLTIRSIGYADYPWWVTERNWDAAVFVDTEGRGSRSSEGIYAAQVPVAVIQNYLTGFSADSSQNLDEMTPQEWRVEYTFDLHAQPLLYYSPVDRKLHLLGARQGLWKINDDQSIRYDDLDGDQYVDLWTFFQNDRLLRQLITSSDYMIVATPGNITIKQHIVRSALFHTVPPRNQEEWHVLGQRMEDDQHTFTPGDFEAMIAQFDEPVTRIEGVTLRDFRPTTDGFRFILELGSEFQVVGGEDWLRVQGLVPGEYVVMYDGVFHVQSLTPARSVLVPGSLGVEEGVVALHPMRIVATLRNEGLEDTKTITAYLHTVQPEVEDEMVSKMEATLLAGEETEVSFVWTPLAAGRWEAWLTIDDGEVEQSLAMDRFIIEVAPAPQPDLRWALERVGVAGGAWAIFGLGVGLAGIAMALFSLVLRPPVKGS